MKPNRWKSILTCLALTAMMGGTSWAARQGCSAQSSYQCPCPVSCSVSTPPGGSTSCNSGTYHATCISYNADGTINTFIHKVCDQDGDAC